MNDEINRRRFGQKMGHLAGLATLTTPLRSAFGQQTRPRNILFICSDQHSGGVMGCASHGEVETPHMDRLASRGVRFSNTYCGSPVCVPGRATLLTGRYPSDIGSYCNSTPFDGRVPTWGNLLRDSGYTTWATGKLDLEEGQDFGFEEVDTTHGHTGNPDITSLFRRPLCYRVNERPGVDGSTRQQPYRDAERMKSTLEFLGRQDTRNPWCAYVGFLLPHPPFVALDRYMERYPAQSVSLPDLPEGYLEEMHTVLQSLRSFKRVSTPISEDRVRRARAAYFALVSELDEYVGRLVEQIEQSGEWDNTIIVYTSDHGEMHGEHGLWYKNNLLEEASRIPLIMAGGGLPEGKTIATPVSHVDVVATLLDFAGIESPSGMPGTSLLPLVDGQPNTHPGWVYSESHSEGNETGSFMIRKGPWKYIYFSWFEPLLFHLERDPGEKVNLAGQPQYQSIQQELHELLLSQVDPEQVTEAAFKEQERRLQQMVRTHTAEEFRDRLTSRLGRGQASVLMNQYYPGSH